MSASLIKKVSELHESVADAVAHLRGQEITQAKILAAYAKAFPEREIDLKWIQGADHSRNHTNRAPCECSKTAKAIFERVGRSRYLVL